MRSPYGKEIRIDQGVVADMEFTFPGPFGHIRVWVLVFSHVNVCAHLRLDVTLEYFDVGVDFRTARKHPSITPHVVRTVLDGMARCGRPWLP